LVVCLGFSAPALAQTYDALPVPADITIDSTSCRAVGGQAEIDGTMQQIVGRACLQPGERIAQASQRFSALPLAGGDVGVKLMAKTSFEELVVKRWRFAPRCRRWPPAHACPRTPRRARGCRIGRAFMRAGDA
jgi:hypothetical protein